MEKKNEINSSQDSNDNRRDFLKRYGKYAAVTPVVLTTLMTPNTSAACTTGNGKCKDAPGQN